MSQMAFYVLSKNIHLEQKLLYRVIYVTIQ